MKNHGNEWKSFSFICRVRAFMRSVRHARNGVYVQIATIRGESALTFRRSLAVMGIRLMRVIGKLNMWMACYTSARFILQIARQVL